MTLNRRSLNLVLGATLALAALPVASLAATNKSTAYYTVGMGTSTAYLVDLLPKKKARVVAFRGAGTGGVVTDDTQKLITLDVPLSDTFEFFDSCGLAIQVRDELRQFVVRDLPGGKAQVVEMGVKVNIGGCEDGLTVPYGAPTDAGVDLQRLSMSARPPVADLVPGTVIAGFSEEPRLPNGGEEAVDVVTLQAGMATFQTTGHTVPASFDADQWLVFVNPGFERGYTRVAIDSRTGGETWLQADWAGGKPQSVEAHLVVKPMAGAGFGSVAQASRMWESGLFIGSRRPFFFHLYKDGTGERVAKDLDLGTEGRTPITAWGFDGLNLLQTREFGYGRAHRTWVPLRNEGKYRWVMEWERVELDGEEPYTLIERRINYYQDDGKAVPPPVRTRTPQGVVYLNTKPALPR